MYCLIATVMSVIIWCWLYAKMYNSCEKWHVSWQNNRCLHGIWGSWSKSSAVDYSL